MKRRRLDRKKRHIVIKFLEKVKKLLPLLILMSVVFGQDTLETSLTNEKVLDKKTNWFIDVGLFSDRAPNLFSITRDSKISDNLSWFVTGGIGLHILGIGIVRNLKRESNHETNLSLMVGFLPPDSPQEVFSLYLFDEGSVHIAWTKDRIINTKLRYSWGISIPLFYYGYDREHEIYEDPNFQSAETFLGTETRLEIDSFFTTVGSIDVLAFLPFPILNITYDFGK